MEGQPITDLIEANLCDRCAKLATVRCAIPDPTGETIAEIRTVRTCPYMTGVIQEEEISGIIDCDRYQPQAE